MGAPEVLMVLFLVGVPAALGWCIWSLAHRRRNARHYVRALGRVARRPDPGSADPDHDDFWSTP